MTTLYSCSQCGANMEEVEGPQICVACLRKISPLTVRTRQVQVLHKFLPEIAEKWAKHIVEDIFKGDGVADDIEELLLTVESVNNIDDSFPFFESTTLNDHYTELVWEAIATELLRQLREKS